MRLDCQILLKSPSPLHLLAGSAPAYDWRLAETDDVFEILTVESEPLPASF